MQSEFNDRLLTCVDCHSQFVFTAGEQIFFLDKQFKNDPKRCKPCKAKRQTLGSRISGSVVAAGMARTETRTECSECHIETTVPFKPTQGRPVLCRQCFQVKRAVPALEVGPPVGPLSTPFNPAIAGADRRVDSYSESMAQSQA